MSSHGLTKENILATLPLALQGDKSVVALADALAGLLARRREEIDRLLIYPRIERLDEPLLDILAQDFKVDWWDPEYSLEEKRRTLKSSWRVHKTLGTKSAVETALRAIYPSSWAEAWFLYGGKPYHFRLHIDLTGAQMAQGKPVNVIERVRFYQSLRDHMDAIQYTISLPPAVLHIGGGTGAHTGLGVPPGRDAYGFRGGLSLGGSVGAAPSVGVPELADKPAFRRLLSTGGAFGAQHTRPAPEDPAQPPRTTILHTGGVCTMISNP